MSAIEDFLAEAPPVPVPTDDFRRDQWDRPLIAQPDGGRPQPYTRSSGAAKPIEDTYNLEKWARRNVAYGLAVDASLVARVIAFGGTPDQWDQATKNAVDSIVEDANTAAKAHKAADIGTSLHTMTQRSDEGEDVQAGIYQPYLDAYRAAMTAAGIVVHRPWIECRMVCDELAMAGTADRLVTLTPDSVLRRYLRDLGVELADDEAVVLDLKTGRTVQYGGLGFAAQLAAYSRGQLYDVAGDVRIDTPRLCQSHGIIVHLPSTANPPECTIYLVNLEQGYVAAEVANQVRELRKASKQWMIPVNLAPAVAAAPELDRPAAQPDPPTGDGGPVDNPDPYIVEQAALLGQRLVAAVAAGVTSVAWPAGVPTFKQGGPATWGQLLAVETVVLAAERSVGLPTAPAIPFPPGDPASAAPVKEPVVAPAPTLAAAPYSLDQLADMNATLPADLQHEAVRLVSAAGVPSDRRRWTSDHIPTITTILQDLVATAVARAEHVEQLLADWDGTTSAFLFAATGTSDAPTVSLTQLQVERLEALTATADSGGISVLFDADGTPLISENPTTEAALLEAYGSKSAVLAAAKTIAGVHGIAAPRSAAAVAADPVLAALTLSAATSKETTQ